jgi:hypothetical protein
MKRYIAIMLLWVLLMVAGCATIEEPKTTDSSLLVGRLRRLDTRISYSYDTSVSETYWVTVSTPNGTMRYRTSNVDSKGFFFIPNVAPGEYMMEDFSITTSYSYSFKSSGGASQTYNFSSFYRTDPEVKSKMQSFRFKISPGEINYIGFIDWDWKLFPIITYLSHKSEVIILNSGTARHRGCHQAPG